MLSSGVFQARQQLDSLPFSRLSASTSGFGHGPHQRCALDRVGHAWVVESKSVGRRLRSGWEQVFLKDEQIEPFIRQGSFVPIYVHEDGGALFELRVGSITMPAMPTPNESNWTTETSEPYLFQSDGMLTLRRMG